MTPLERLQVAAIARKRSQAAFLDNEKEQNKKTGFLDDEEMAKFNRLLTDDIRR